MEQGSKRHTSRRRVLVASRAMSTHTHRHSATLERRESGFSPTETLFLMLTWGGREDEDEDVL